MSWPLIAAGVTAGLGLVIAKQWFGRRVEGQEHEAGFRRQGAESASAHGAYPHQEEPPQASGAAADVQTAPAPPPAASDTPVTETEPPFENAPDTEAAVSEAGDAKSVAEPDAAVSSEPDPGASPQRMSDDKPVEEALASGDLSVMETVLQETDDPIHRNLLLNRLVAGHYRLRSEPEHREVFYRVAHGQIDEATAILNAIEITGKPRPDYIEAFKSVAIALGEDERYDEALAICEKALSLGLEDGTKTGFKGRIVRLKKSRDAE